MDSNDHNDQKQSNTTSTPSTSSNGETANDSSENLVSTKRKIDDTEDNDDLSDSEIDFDTYYNSLKEEIDEEEMATGLFGSSDENNCTYLEGYVERQPLYACNTCKMNTDPSNGDNKYLAGICFACAENCHKDHELFELFSKRNFRCDCGNDKFSKNKCKLFDKVGCNENNKYNHNFNGLYCTCERPYPSEDFEDDMLQCGICEDWFHLTHLETTPRKGYSDMICLKCIQTYDFLVYYHTDGCFYFEECDQDETLQNELSIFCTELEQKIAEAELFSKGICKLIELKDKYKEKFGEEKVDQAKCKTMYLPLEWRLKLCRCSSCLQMYDELQIPFITNPRDMLSVYMYLNQVKETEKQFSNVNRAQQIELLHGIDDLKKELSMFFQKCKENKKDLIKREDVAEFIEKLKNKRKRVGIQYFCR